MALIQEDIRLRFGHLEVRPDTRRVLLHGTAHKLQGRAFDVLMALINHRDRTVTRAELLDTVWPDEAVVDNNLTMQIGVLRRLLGPDTIVTLPGRGYRFVPPDDQGSGSGPAAEAATEPSAQAPARTLHGGPLIGRESDSLRLGELIGSQRLVTIVGPGGVGKSRLVCTVLAERLADRSAALVDLTTVSDGQQIAATVGRALGLQLAAGDPAAALTSALAKQDLLIVLDNAEHVLEATAHLLAHVLANAPRQAVVVTSQAPLRLQQEWLLRLQPLQVPEADATLEDAGVVPAVQVFVQRARALDLRFALDAGNLRPVVQICRQLDGVPLCLELAASRVPLLGAAGIADSLGERLRLLTGGRRDMPARHRTLRSAMEWSHDLLDAAGRAMLRRLAVFVGSFSLEAALMVAADLETDSTDWSLIDTFGELIDRSLISVLEGDAPRYRLLESTRALALQHLMTSGEAAAAQDRHVAAMARQIGTAFSERFTSGQRIDRLEAALEPDLDNAREALLRAVAHDMPEAVGLATNYWAAYSKRLMMAEAQRLWTETRHLVARASVDPVQRARWHIAASMVSTRSAPLAALDDARAAIELLRGTAQPWDRCCALYASASAQVRIDGAREPDTLASLLEECTGDAPPIVRHLVALLQANRHHGGGAPALALPWYERARAAAREAGTFHSYCVVSVAVADLTLLLGRADEAVSQGRQLLQELEHFRSRGLAAYALLNLMAALLVQGDLREASAACSRLLPLAFRDYDHRAALSNYVAALALGRQQPELAAGFLGYGERLYRQAASQRQGNEAAAHRRTWAEAQDKLGPQAFGAALASGEGWDDAAAERLAAELTHPTREGPLATMQADRGL